MNNGYSTSDFAWLSVERQAMCSAFAAGICGTASEGSWGGSREVGGGCGRLRVLAGQYWGFPDGSGSSAIEIGRSANEFGCSAMGFEDAAIEFREAAMQFGVRAIDQRRSAIGLAVSAIDQRRAAEDLRGLAIENGRLCVESGGLAFENRLSAIDQRERAIGLGLSAIDQRRSAMRVLLCWKGFSGWKESEGDESFREPFGSRWVGGRRRSQSLFSICRNQHVTARPHTGRASFTRARQECRRRRFPNGKPDTEPTIDQYP
jgi:hypothetical protein